MKKVVFLTSAFWLLLFVLYACTKEKHSPAKKEPLGNRQQSSLRNSSASVDEPGTCGGPQPAMPYVVVKQMINNYGLNQLAAINSALQIADARACTFDFEKLKAYICHLEALLEQNQCPLPGKLGLRFYYAAHNAMPPLDGVPDDYKRRHTLIVIPTYADSAGNNIDFDPAYFDRMTCRPLPLHKLHRGALLDNIITSEPAAIGDIFAMDHGQLGPPKGTGMAF